MIFDEIPFAQMCNAQNIILRHSETTITNKAFDLTFKTLSDALTFLKLITPVLSISSHKLRVRNNKFIVTIPFIFKD
jgi:hypothetical protein